MQKPDATTPASSARPATTVDFRRESRILRATVAALLADGFVVRVHDGEDISKPLASPRDCVEYVVWHDEKKNRDVWNVESFQILANKGDARASVLFIMANGNDGRDAIADHSVALTQLLDPIIQANG